MACLYQHVQKEALNPFSALWEKRDGVDASRVPSSVFVQSGGEEEGAAWRLCQQPWLGHSPL